MKRFSSTGPRTEPYQAVRPGRVLSAALGFLTVGALSGCGGGGGSPAVPSAVPLSVSAATPSGLTATLAEDRSAVLSSGRVTYTLTLSNGTAQPITFQTQVGCGVDAGGEGATVRVTDAAGAVVYPDPAGAVCAAIGTGPPVTLAPGQSLSETFVPPLAAFAAAGRHQVTASFSIEAPAASDFHFQYTRVGPLPVDVQ